MIYAAMESVAKFRFFIKRGLKRFLLAIWSWTESRPKLRAWIKHQIFSVPWLANRLRRIRRFDLSVNRMAYDRGDPRTFMPKTAREVYTDLLRKKN